MDSFEPSNGQRQNGLVELSKCSSAGRVVLRERKVTSQGGADWLKWRPKCGNLDPVELTVFVILGLIGVVTLVASLVIGEIMDSLSVLDVGCSSSAIGAFFVVLGFVGETVRQNGGPLWVAWIAALVASIAVAVGVQRLINRVVKAETGLADYSIVGMQGEVRIPVTDKSGEVKLDDARELEPRLARIAGYKETNSIPKGTRVIVLEQKGVHAIVEPVANVFDFEQIEK